MKEVPRVAVLLAAYNGIGWIEQQVSSILSQKDVVITIYASIDLSIDGTFELMERLASVDDRLKLLTYGASFGGAASNFFRLMRDVDFSSYDYVSFSDQDDIWNSSKLTIACDVLSAKGFDAYSSNVTAFWLEEGRRELIDKAQAQVLYDHLFESAGPGCTFVFTRDLAEVIKKEVGKLDDRVWMHDWFIYSFARHNGFSWVIDNVSTMSYRQHSSNVVGANIGLRAAFLRARLVLKGDWFQRVLNQAELIGQDGLLPIELLRKKDRISYLKLALLARCCRRKTLDQVYFFVLCMLFCVIGGS